MALSAGCDTFGLTSEIGVLLRRVLELRTASHRIASHSIAWHGMAWHGRRVEDRNVSIAGCVARGQSPAVD